MAKRKIRTSKRVFIGMVCAAFVFMVFVLPRFWPVYCCKGHCSGAETDAMIVAAAIADYFAVPDRTDVKPSDIEEWVFTENPWTFIRKGDEIYISVTDAKKNCPIEYQHSLPEWDRWVYTKVMPYTDPADR